jgi:hypothetical protein
MTLEQIYQLALKLAIDADPRGKEGIAKFLKRKKEYFENLPKFKKDEYDPEDLINPYPDSRILYGDPSLEVDKILAGIDIDTGEVLLADRLNQKGAGIDLILSHHPMGGSYASLHEVMGVEVDVLAKYGVPENVGEGIMRDRIGEVQRGVSPRNHNQAVDAARLLGFAVMCTHTMADNLVHTFMEKLFQRKSPDTLGDVLKILKERPEYKEAMKGKAGPMLFVGQEHYRTGKIAPIEFTGGTEPAKEIYERLSQAGVGTVIGMHASEDHRKEAIKHHINLVIAGHMSSDSLGMNLLLDELEKRGVGVIACSGLIRERRSR